MQIANMLAAKTAPGLRKLLLWLQAVSSYLTSSNILRAKRDKYPYGYPGDEPSATGAIRYTCHLCRKHFPPIPNPSSPEGQELGDDLPRLDCIRCGHTRCDSCPRARPGEVEPGPDAEIVRTVEAKLTALQL